MSNRCGNSSYTFYLSQNGQYRGYSVSPNPAKSDFSINFATKEVPDDLLTDILLFNEKGKLVRTFNVDEAKKANYFKDNKTVVFNIDDLPKGTYFLHVAYGDEVNKSQLVKE